MTVTSERYVAMLQNFCIPYLEENEKDNIWFPQGVCAIAHTAWISMDLSK